MLVSYNWLKDYLKGKLPNPRKLAELLTMHSFEVVELKKVGKDWLLDIDILPNRAHDCLSYIGIAREIAAITSLSIRDRVFVVREDKKLKITDFVTIEVEDKKACPRYTARVIVDVKIQASPQKIQQRLRTLGLQPINNIVDILNYVMLETGQPLHAFDYKKISNLKSQNSKKIIIRKAKKNEKIITLDGEKLNLDNNVLVIADDKEPLAIAGIKGGKKAEITKFTKTILIESANFEMKTIRRARQKLSLQTEASLRFEHEPDPNLTITAINRAAQMIQEICGGRITQGLIDIYPKPVLPRKIRLNLDYVKSLLGIEISKNEVLKIFKKLGFKILDYNLATVSSQPSAKPLSKFKILRVEIPIFRQDLSIPEDLIEEIARVYGLERIPAKLPQVLVILPKRNENIFWEKICKDTLKEAGLSEVYNYSFISQKDAQDFSFDKKNLIEIKNPISLDQKYLRPSLIPNLLKNTRENSKRFPEINIFELGKIYKKSPTPSFKGQILEKRMLTGLITGDAFYQSKGIVDLLLQKLGIANVWYDDFEATPEESKISIWRTNRCAEIKVNHTEIGFLGELQPKIINELDISKKVIVFELDFEKLSRLCLEAQEYQSISRFPAAIRDLAILIPREVKVVEVLNKINAVGGSLIRDVDLFDIYEGAELPQGKKNLAFHLIYQAEDRTLNKEEIDKIHQKIIKVLEKNPAWEVRK